MLIPRAMDRLSDLTWLDRPAAVLRTAVTRALPSQSLRDVLHGVWLGHPLHPALAMGPVGMWSAAALLDGLDAVAARRPGGPVRPDRQQAATVLVAAGIATSLPAAAAGTADWSQLRVDQQRVGLVHAASNVLALGLYAGSLVARLRGRAGLGRALAFAGVSVVGGSAAIGGHLSYRWSAGANHAEHVPHVVPGDWADLGPLDDLSESRPSSRTVGTEPVVVVRQGTRISVLADRCSHLSGPLSQGDIVGQGAQACIVCPWHGSTFRLVDGAVVHGPATSPQPGFDVRIHAGRVQAHVRELPGVPAG